MTALAAPAKIWIDRTAQGFQKLEQKFRATTRPIEVSLLIRPGWLLEEPRSIAAFIGDFPREACEPLITRYVQASRKSASQCGAGKIPGYGRGQPTELGGWPDLLADPFAIDCCYQRPAARYPFGWGITHAFIAVQEINIYSHSTLLYWWPAWAVGTILVYFLLVSGDVFLRKLVNVIPTFRDNKRRVSQQGSKMLTKVLVGECALDEKEHEQNLQESLKTWIGETQ